MNLRRVAALLRELADEVERDDERTPAPPPAKSRPRQRRSGERPEPEIHPDPVTLARVDRLLRKAGVPPR